MSPPSPKINAVRVIGIVVVVQAVLVSLFAWSAGSASLRDLTVAVSGESASTQDVVQTLDAATSGAVTVDDFDSSEEAREALRAREAHAAVVEDADTPTLLVASGASPALSQALRAAVAEAGSPVTVEDVAPLPEDDPSGAGLGQGFFPLLLTNIVSGLLLTLLVRSPSTRIVAVLAYSVISGLVGATIMTFALGVVEGSFLAVAGTLALIALAVSAAVTGLGSILGVRGIGLGAVVILLIGLPLSGVASSHVMMAFPWGSLGQALPGGAGIELLRSVAFFSGAGSMAPALVLSAWAMLGAVLLALSLRRRPQGAAAPAQAAEEQNMAV